MIYLARAMSCTGLKQLLYSIQCTTAVIRQASGVFLGPCWPTIMCSDRKLIGFLKQARGQTCFFSRANSELCIHRGRWELVYIYPQVLVITDNPQFLISALEMLSGASPIPHLISWFLCTLPYQQRRPLGGRGLRTDNQRSAERYIRAL